MENHLIQNILQICSTCKKEKDIFQFNKSNLSGQEITKTCSECINKRQKVKCVHNKRKSECKYCGGSEICVHEILKRHCKKCKGSGICEHNKCRYKCTICKGSQVCEHIKLKRKCKICSPNFCKMEALRHKLGRILKKENPDDTKIIEHLGCTEKYFKDFFNSKKPYEMEEYQIDHIKPCSKFNLDDDVEFNRCSHYSNIQPLTLEENATKSNTWNDIDDEFWEEHIFMKDYREIYIPQHTLSNIID